MNPNQTVNAERMNEVHQLFYTLFQQKGALSFKEYPELFKLHRDPEVLPLIRSFEEIFHCKLITLHQDMLYLIPTMENEIFSLTENAIKKFGKAKTRKDVYLIYYICLMTLNTLYVPRSSQQEFDNEFVTTDGMIELVEQRLSDAVERVKDHEFLEENAQSSQPLIHEIENIEQIYHHWNAKIGGEGKNQKHKVSFIDHVFNFLENQGLLVLKPLAGGGKQAYGTERLNAVMTAITYGEHERLVAKLLGEVDWSKYPDFTDETKEYRYFQEELV